ncbi:MAG: hypothetical protein GTN81_05160 [Proteobacteria bacterium]|nr:hypothetical protein [Pseudomonadota bacterium]
MESVSSNGEEQDVSKDLEEGLRQKNFVRAEGLARILNRSESEIRDYQEKAFRHHVVEVRNPQGAIALAREFNFTKDEVDQLLVKILQEASEEEAQGTVEARRRFDMRTKRYLDLEEWVREYFKGGKWQKR